MSFAPLFTTFHHFLPLEPIVNYFLGDFNPFFQIYNGVIPVLKVQNTKKGHIDWLFYTPYGFMVPCNFFIFNFGHKKGADLSARLSLLSSIPSLQSSR